MVEPVVRVGSVGDLTGINDIYNHYVRKSPATFDLEPTGMPAREAWFGHYAPVGRHRLLVVDEGHGVAGYATSSPFMERAAYDPSVTVSVYLDPQAQGRGLGRVLYAALFASIAGEDVHRAYAGIAMPNRASVALHERFGFRRVAYFTEQGRKFGRYWDVAWYEKPMP
jgi:phosphinothricin acetyltransferase